MAADETPAPPSRHRHSWSSFIFWTFILLATYVLSIGPVAKYCSNGPASWLRAFYAPLLALDGSVPFFHDFLLWYGNLWGLWPE